MTEREDQSCPRPAWRVIGKVIRLTYAASISTLAGALVGFCILLAAMPHEIILSVWLVPLAVAGVFAGMAAPTTFVLLPAVALVTPKRNARRKTALFIAGGLGGALTLWFFARDGPPGFQALMTFAGAIAGITAGGTFGATLDPPQRPLHPI